ncbi:conserved oligomeric Golgi complex subunit 2-like isoform X3 [Mustela putorius furo]|uniref:Conserved oligomeric Golgi complex subunit 2 n=1 Tax=Mustela putorius furo TaxID=9669 RepID=A0A8U0RF97_MUSPF|nr:conserved oligomeric Golgi complex subunit 2-like isoform X3 [Mustela putorius furo]
MERSRMNLPKGPDTLCFHKDEFMKEDFDIDHFVSDCRKCVQLEELRGDLELYYKLLKIAMVKLINKDHADFVNLSTNLSLRSSVSEGIRAVDERMCKQEDIRKKKRIAHITAMLQQSLGGLLLEGLQTSNVDIIWHCLRTYATIDKTRDAEALVGQVLVKPYMDEVIVEQIVESHPDGLKIMYANKLLEFVPHHCRLLREVTGGTISRKTLLRYALPVRVTVSSATWTRFGNVLHINVSKCLLY